MKHSQPAKLEALLQQGLIHHQAGRLAEAEGIYRQVLAIAPEHPSANNFLGVLASQVGRHDVAAELFKKAIQAQAKIPEFHNNLGLALLSLSQREDAAASFRRAIHLNPKFPEAYNNLGTALQELKQPEGACKSFETALKLKPDYAEATFNVGNVHLGERHYDQAARYFELAISLRPGYAKAHCGLGSARQRLNQQEAAEKSFRKAIELQPGFADAHTNLAAFLRETGRLAEAEQAYLQALLANPYQAEAHNGLGELYQLQGKMEQAEAAFLKAIELKADYPEAHNNLGVLLAERGRLEEALESYRKALAIRPDFVFAMNNMGIIYADMGRLSEAMDCYRLALAQDPDFAMAYSNLGNSCRELGQIDEARACYEQALALNPDEDVTLSNLGNVLMVEGKLHEAKVAYQRALTLNPANAVAHSNLIFLMDFDAGTDVATQQGERRKWNALNAVPLRETWRPHDNDRDPERVLRIGYVSADFRMHSAAYAFEPMLCRYEREKFEVYCYSNSARSDQVTEKFRNCVTGWRNIFGKSDQEAAGLIRADRIDILVDLSAHSAGNRLLMFARKPAPVQVSGWGHANGTGMEAMDYLFSDPVSIPDGERHFFAEKIAYLPCQIAYACPEDAPPVSGLPMSSKGHVTFGCFSRLVKITDASLSLWAELLHSLPNARLVIKSKELSDAALREIFIARMERFSIDGKRVILLGKTTWYDHMAAYAQVDVALDPFPHGGGIGSFEALWMGVPVITLRGNSLPGRLTAAIETSVGLDDWVSESPTQYLELAVQKVAEPEVLAALRTGLRKRLALSPAGAPGLIMMQVEWAYREMWRKWCDESQTLATEENRQI